MKSRVSFCILWSVIVMGVLASCNPSHAVKLVEKEKTKDVLHDLQADAIHSNRSAIVHWGIDTENFKGWTTHSNRLIPIYTFGTAAAGPGIDLNSYLAENSAYRDPARIKKLYDGEPSETLNPEAEYCDQTDIARLQQAALAAGRKYVFLIVFDGMDWQTTRAAAIYKSCCVGYDSGRGQGLHFQDYTADGTSQFGFMVTSPHNTGTEVDVDRQTLNNPNGTLGGGYSVVRGGPYPWTPGRDRKYAITKNDEDTVRHAYTDSASSATSMNTGIKTFNGSINVDATGHKRPTVAFQAQLEGYSVGAVSSVPISHATPAATYAHNVSRNDYQDLSRDLVGLPSVSHPEQPLPGLDVLIGGGYGVSAQKNPAQGSNFAAGNIYLTDADLEAIDVENGGKYVVAKRTAGVQGSDALQAAAEQAATSKKRLLGFYGTDKGNLPYATADGDYQCAPGIAKAECYTPADLGENPTLAEMTQAAITVLSTNPKGFWLMVEAGDVDWANHDDNLDNSIGAVFSGDDAVRTVTDWVEQNSNWQESVVIVTADHGHYLFLDHPEGLIPTANDE